MKFDAIVGNPPYQEEVAKQQSLTNGESRKSSVFQYFQEIADKISEKYVCLIYPGGRWIHRSGKGMSEFGLTQINDKKMELLHFFADANDVFGDVAIADGITMVYKNKQKNTSGFTYVFHKGGTEISSFVENPGEELLPLNPNDVSIVAKATKFVEKYNLKWLDKRILSQKLFGVESSFVQDNPDKVRPYINNDDIDFDKEVKLYTNNKAGKSGRAQWYVTNRKNIPTNSQYIDEWQVVVSSANAGGQKRANQIAIIDNHSAFGRSRVGLASFKTESEAKNFFEYAKTYFIRFMFLMTDESLTSLGKKVPDLLDYSTSNKLLDFSKPLDNQLYLLVDLTKNEIEYLEKVIKAKDNSNS